MISLNGGVAVPDMVIERSDLSRLDGPIPDVNPTEPAQASTPAGRQAAWLFVFFLPHKVSDPSLCDSWTKGCASRCLGRCRLFCTGWIPGAVLWPATG